MLKLRLARTQTAAALATALAAVAIGSPGALAAGKGSDHKPAGEDRSWGRRLAKRFGVDTDYDEESFFVRQAYFLGDNDPYKALKTTLKAEINEDAWATLHSDTSRPFDKPASGRIAVKVINHLGDEVMKVYRGYRQDAVSARR